ncbi:hypothetical protein GQ457_14G008590 [Hibiscus cannabinus]
MHFQVVRSCNKEQKTGNPAIGTSVVPRMFFPPLPSYSRPKSMYAYCSKITRNAEMMAYEIKPQRANNMATTFMTSILSPKEITARIGMIGKATTLTEFANKEDTSKSSAVVPMLKPCHRMHIHTKTMMYDVFPSSYPSISPLRPFHSPLTKSPTIIALAATSD